jgi:hypothetical protein
MASSEKYPQYLDQPESRRLDLRNAFLKAINWPVRLLLLQMGRVEELFLASKIFQEKSLVLRKP